MDPAQLSAARFGAPLMTAREVAGELGVSAETVLRWTKRGALPGFRLPSGALRYRADELHQWMEARATPRPEVSHQSQSDAARPDPSADTLRAVTNPEGQE
jgi:excisionase family DNA binding protein